MDGNTASSQLNGSVSTSSGLDVQFALFSLGCLIPIGALIALVGRYGVNVPFWDQWDFVPFLRRSNTSGVRFSDLWAQHNEHRLVFPRLLMLLSARLTDWNTRAEMALNVAVASVTFGLLASLLRRTFRDSGINHLPLAAITSLFVFSPAQWGNWLWGWQLQWFLNALAVIACVAILSLSKPTWRPGAVVLLASGTAIIGQLSLASGVLIWLVCLPIFFARKHLRRFSIVWLLFALLATAAYIHNYNRPAHHPPFAKFYSDPAAGIGYVSRYLGGPLLGVSKGEAEAMGLRNYGHILPATLPGFAVLLCFLLAVAFLLAKRKALFEAGLPWLALGAYGVMTAFLTALGRTGLGTEQAASSRYTTISTILVISTLALITLILTHGRERPLSAGRGFASFFPWLLASALVLTNYGSHIDAMQSWSLQREEGRKCLMVVRSPDDPCLRLTYFETEKPFREAQYLKRIGWGGLRSGNVGPSD